MSNIALDSLQPGMVLARDVRGSNGLVLLGEGAEISERHIEIFRSWGVTDVEIKGEDPETLNTEILKKLDGKQRAKIERELDRLFQHNDPRDPVIEELRKICLIRETMRIEGQP